MNFKRLMRITVSGMMAASLTACSSTSASSTSSSAASSDSSYKSIELGTTGKDITATIKVLTNRTDMMQDTYSGKKLKDYVADFNALYPNITVEYEALSDYEGDSLLRLQGGDWGDVMLIPAVDPAEFSNYFISYGSVDDMSSQIRYADSKAYDGQVYGVPSSADGQGIVYNKKVFKDAGITTLPKTPEEFLKDLQLIKDKTSVEAPLYTNYAAAWAMAQWDQYIGGTASGDDAFMNQEMLHASNPFAKTSDGTGPYSVYKILYDAVQNGLTEADYSTTDWDSSKAKLNNGQIGTMVLGSWAYPQMVKAGTNTSDVGYMPFPISINGKQYSTASPNYSYAVNKNDDADKQLAAEIYVKWLTEKSSFAYNEGGMPICASDDKFPEVYSSFSDVTMLPDKAAVSGEENLLKELGSESELNINNGGGKKVQAIVEHASNKDKTYDEIIDEWNQKWTAAQKTLGVEVK